MQLFAMPPPETSGTRSKPKSWASDITSPFASRNERLELRGPDDDAVSTSKSDKWDQRRRTCQ
eukprot:6481207-Alexandrium_andersonii.AAC.1